MLTEEKSHVVDDHRNSICFVAARLFGRNISPSFPQTGSWIHILLVVAVILVVLQLLGIVNL